MTSASLTVLGRFDTVCTRPSWSRSGCSARRWAVILGVVAAFNVSRMLDTNIHRGGSVDNVAAGKEGMPAGRFAR